MLNRLVCGLAGLCIVARAFGGDGDHAAAVRRLAERFGGEVLVSAAGRPTTVYGAALAQGSTAEESARLFVSRFGAALRAEGRDLRGGSILDDGRHTRTFMPDPATGRPKFTLVYFAQERDGLPVSGGELRVLVRNEPGHPVVLVRSALRDLGGFRREAVDANAAAVEAAARTHAPGMVNFGPGRPVIWAGADGAAPPLPARTAVEFVVDNGATGAAGFQRDRLIVDAATGVLLERETLVLHDDIVGSVRALATAGSLPEDCAPEPLTPLPYARVWITGGAAAFADAAGSFIIPDGGGVPVTVSSDIRGEWFRVFSGAGGTELLSLLLEPPAPAHFVHNAGNTSSAVRAQVNAYFHANATRDLVLRYCPSFPVIGAEASFPINVNIGSSCNAFYDGASINFFAAGGGCANTAYGTLVHHEYGHHLVRVAGSGQGAYGEGMGDVMGVLITDDPVHAYGFYGDCALGSRTASNSCQYSAAGCSTCGSGIHACGQLLSGCVWSTREALREMDPASYRAVISSLAINSMLLHVGTEIDPSITIDYLTLDDDDALIANGTPHYQQIAAGFGAHGLPAPARLSIDFRYSSGRPELLDPFGRTVLHVEVVPVTDAPREGSAVLYLDTGAGFAPVALRVVSPHVYEAAMPGGECGRAARYYLVAEAIDGSMVTSPPGAPLAAFDAVIASSARTVLVDDAEVERGWTLGVPGDTAITGQWVRADPIGTIAQPEDDGSPDPGIACFFTAQGAPGGGPGQADVDAGIVTLVSPAIGLSGAAAARVSYWRWYSNDLGDAPNQDTLVVEISGDDGASWTTAETVGPGGPGTSGGWVYHEFHAGGVTIGGATRVRFIASDLGDPSLVEAAVDEFSVTAYHCGPRCRADWDTDGVVTSQDLFAFLGDFFDVAPSADFNADGRIDSDDFFQFLTEFFTPCP